MVNQSNPLGTLNYSQSGTNADGTPQYTSTTNYTPAVQKLLTGFQGLQGGQQAAAQGLLNSGAGALGGKGLDLSYNGTATSLDALNKARLDPQWAQNTDQQESKLAAQGMTPGTAGYDASMRNFNQAKNDAYNSANLADYQTSANSAEKSYLDPLSAYTSLAGGSQPQAPQFTNTPTANVAGTNISGLVEQNYQTQMAQYNAMMGGLFGMAGTAGGAAAKAALA